MEQKQLISPTEQKSLRLSLWMGLAANVLVTLLSLHFYWVPPGARIHPAIWVLSVIVIAFVAFGTLPFMMPLFRQRRPELALWLALTLCVSPFPLGAAILHHAAWLRGFSFY